MTGRRQWAVWAVVIAVGHVAGSYGLELDSIDHRGHTVAAMERWAAPVRCLPILVAWTYRSADDTGAAWADVWGAWVVYGVLFAAVLTVAPLVSCFARRRRAEPQGFPPILPADRAGSDQT